MIAAANLTCFKGNVDLTDMTLNQNVATYVKLAPAPVTQTEPEGSSLSGGVIAGGRCGRLLRNGAQAGMIVGLRVQLGARLACVWLCMDQCGGRESAAGQRLLENCSAIELL